MDRMLTAILLLVSSLLLFPIGVLVMGVILHGFTDTNRRLIYNDSGFDDLNLFHTRRIQNKADV